MSIDKQSISDYLKKVNVSSVEELTDEQILDFAATDVDLEFFMNYFVGHKHIYEMSQNEIAAHIRKGLVMGKKPEVYIDYADRNALNEDKEALREFKVIYI